MKLMRRRTLLTGAATLATALARAKPAGAQRQAAAPVRIGFSMPRTGYLGVASPVAEQAYILWSEQVNARGGLVIAGSAPRPVRLVSYDDQSEPTKTAEIYETLISDDQVDLLLAPFGTPFHIAVVPVVEQHGFPVIGNTAMSTLLRDMQVQHMWFVQALPDAYATAMVAFLMAQGIKTVSLLTLQLPASLETKKFLLPLLGAHGITLVTNVEYPLSTTDMTGMLSGVKQAQPDAVLCLSYPQDSVTYVNAARELGIAAKLQLLLIGPSEPFFATKFQKADLEGLMTIGEWSPKQARFAEAKAFYDAYVARWKQPPDYLDSIVSYASCQILEQAVAHAGLDHDRLTQAIGSSVFQTIKGPVRFEGAVNVATPPGLLQFQQGAMEIVWPKEIATAGFVPKSGWAL